MNLFGEWNFKIRSIQAGTWLLLIHPSQPESKNTGSSVTDKCALRAIPCQSKSSFCEHAPS